MEHSNGNGCDKNPFVNAISSTGTSVPLGLILGPISNAHYILEIIMYKHSESLAMCCQVHALRPKLK